MSSSAATKLPTEAQFHSHGVLSVRCSDRYVFGTSSNSNSLGLIGSKLETYTRPV